MYSLIVQHKGQTVTHKILNDVEVKSVEGFGAQWVINAFKKYIGLDISKYRLDEWRKTDREFLIYIRPEDLEKLRGVKLNDLGI